MEIYIFIVDKLYELKSCQLKICNMYSKISIIKHRKIIILQLYMIFFQSKLFCFLDTLKFEISLFLSNIWMILGLLP